MLETKQTIIFTIVSALSLALLIWNIILTAIVSRMKKKQNILFSGKNAQTLEQVIIQNNQNIKSLEKDVQDLYDITARIHALAHRGVHKVGTVRFNPFRDLGGDQSFSVAFLDGNNSGVVISSIYSRDGVRIYAKALTKGISEKYPLTGEEKQAITLAANGIQIKTSQGKVSQLG